MLFTLFYTIAINLKLLILLVFRNIRASSLVLINKKFAKYLIFKLSAKGLISLKLYIIKEFDNKLRAINNIIILINLII